MANVTIRNLNKNYENGFHAVKDVNLEIRDKEFVVLVGPSGCGKTTTLRMVAGLEEITSGQILIGENVVNDLPPMDRNIAMVFQNYALYPHMSVYDNMAFGLQMRKYAKDEIEKRVREAADILGIQALLVAFCFGALVEGIAGFGAPVAISASIDDSGRRSPATWWIPTLPPASTSLSPSGRCTDGKGRSPTRKMHTKIKVAKRITHLRK